MSRAVDGSVAERRAALPAELVELAHRANIEVGYVDAFGTERVPSPDALLAVLRAYGHDIDRVGAAGDALRADDRRRAERGLPPVVVAWDGAPTVVEGVVPLTASRVSCRLTGEDGSERRWDEAAGAERIAGGERRNAVTMTIPDDVPPGIWMLEAEAGDWSRTATVVAAPARAYPATRRRRGVFVPLHALHSTLSWGAGNFGDLGDLSAWVSGLGGNLIATLPLLAAFLDEPAEPSPYAPVSRHFW
ncbi:MAG TPA: 4-alpha-glucanotransferase, partial [Acidimicrobiia bacterium]|nr:4-alpha-glucanotransferase [Acidimicrobiia bacterium]